MSKIGKKNIEIPNGVTVQENGTEIVVTGPKGSLKENHKGAVKLKFDGNQITVTPSQEKTTQFQGLYRTLILNMIEGVSTGVSKKLEFNGIGYKAMVNGGELTLNVGYSHPVKFGKIENIEYAVTDNIITVSGIDKVLVGDIAAKIRAVRKPDPYKAKGIKYIDEVVIKKEVKSAK
jgi:large subunit ribosomal protein L6